VRTNLAASLFLLDVSLSIMPSFPSLIRQRCGRVISSDRTGVVGMLRSSSPLPVIITDIILYLTV